MLNFYSEGDHLKAGVDPGVPSGDVLNLWWKCGSGVEAEIMESRLREAWGALLEQIREDAYNQGWKDAKGKRVRKQKYFRYSYRFRFFR